MESVPLPLAIALAGAAVLVALTRFAGRKAGNAIAITTALLVTAACAYVLWTVAHRGMVVYWFGDWKPETHVGIGIDFAVDAIGAGGALLSAFVVTLVLVYSQEYYRDSGPLFNVLVLVFMGAASAMFYTGDVFDLFVFFELSNIALFALSAYKVHDETALDGALVYVITNSVAAFTILFGITLLESDTDQLNMATIGQYLAVHPVQAVVVAAFALSGAGFFLRGSLVPFHFWFADAQASAPSPVGVLLSAVSVELGLYAFARVYWTSFSGAFHHVDVLRGALVAFGCASALFGALMSLGAHHLKRLVAYLTVAHMGVVLVGIGLLTAQGMAAAVLYALGFSAAAASLLFCTGIFVHRFGTSDELEMWGRGRELPLIAVTFALAALCAAGLPAIGTYAGRALLLSTSVHGMGPWIEAVTLLVSTFTGAALLKAVGAVCLGLGEPDKDLTHAERRNNDKSAKDERDQPEEERHIGWYLIAPAIIACLASLGAPMVPQLWPALQEAAAAFVDRGHYYAMTVYGHAAPATSSPQILDFMTSAIWGAIALVAAILIALASLYQRRIFWLHKIAVGFSHPMELLEHLHDGKVGDYVTWFVVGSAVIGGMFVVAYR